jgi:hypothetical protein
LSASSSAGASATLGNPPAEKLTRANHLLWKTQVLPTLRGTRLLGLADGKEPAPPEYLSKEKDGKTTKIPNPAYDTWILRDQQVLTYLLGSLSPEILAQTIGMEHAADVWDLINKMFASRSKANVTHLRGALSNTKKLNMMADQYIGKMRGFATELITAGRTIEDDELVDLILNGLDEDYNGLVTTVNAMTTYTVSELHDLISAHDQRQDMLSSGDGHKKFESSANSANRGRGRRDVYNNKNHYHGHPNGRGGGGGRGGGRGRHPLQGARGRGRGRGGHGGPPKFHETVCQICKKSGHSAHTCWWRYADNEEEEDDSYQGEVNAAYGVDTHWYTDTGATDHITGNLEKLMIRDKYRGKDKIHTANGEGMHISHVGHSSIQTPNHDLHLKNILHVPSVTKSLLSVHKLALDNDTFNFTLGIFLLRIGPRRKFFLEDGVKVASILLCHHHLPHRSKFVSSPSLPPHGGIVA